MLGCGHPHLGNGGRAAHVCTGMPVPIRSIQPGDKARLAAFFSRLSDESRRRRFLGPKPKLSARELEFLTEVDQCRHVALVALDEDAIVGVGRYAIWHDSPDLAALTGTTFATNTPAKALLKHLGFRPKAISAGLAEYELALCAA